MVELGGFELGRVHCVDCLEALKQLPDKCVDLVLTDPPYGIGIADNPVRQKHQRAEWDNVPASQESIDQILRVGANSIIWGGNYFHLPPSKGFLVWDKKQPEDFTLAMIEQAWMSFNSPAKMFRQSVHVEGCLFHPTQKPVALFRWILEKYSKPTDLILDPFMGSGTTGVAAVQLGRQFLGFEIDPEYCRLANERIEAARKGLRLSEYRNGQQTLFGDEE